jgi:hypothetical protein
VFVNDTEWFRDLPERTANLRKLHTPEELELALREVLDDPYAEERTWNRVAETLLRDFRDAIALGPPPIPRRSDTVRGRVFVTLDHKPLRRVLRQVKSFAPSV